MPTNETIIAVPLIVEQPGQTRQFLVRLIEKLDIVLGYRGDDPYVSLSQLQSASSVAQDSLTQLERTVLDVITNLLNDTNGTFTQLLNNTVEALKSQAVILDADMTTQVISNPPTQAEVQALQDQVVNNATYFNDLLIALRDTGIIAT